MSTYPDNLKYAATHEWVRLEEDGTATVGISNHAQDALGDIVFVELPEVGATIHAKDEVAVVESVKSIQFPTMMAGSTRFRSVTSSS